MLDMFLRWIMYSLSITFISWIVPGINVKDFISSMFVVVVLAVVNTLIKPLLLFISLPVNILTLGLFTLVINAFLLMIVSKLAPNFEVENFISAFLGALLLSLFSVFIGRI